MYMYMYLCMLAILHYFALGGAFQIILSGCVVLPVHDHVHKLRNSTKHLNCTLKQKICSDFGGSNALVNQIPHYPPPGPMRGFDKGIDERPFPQGGAFDMILSILCWLKSYVCE